MKGSGMRRGVVWEAVDSTVCKERVMCDSLSLTGEHELTGRQDVFEVRVGGR